MLVTTLATSGFRNLAEQKVAFDRGVNVLFGANGSGKSNLLEAVFTACLGRSQRGAPDAVMLADGAEVYRLEVDVELSGQIRRQTVAYQRGGRKRVTQDGLACRVAELYRDLAAVTMGPEDSAILWGPPSGRRAFVDLYLSQLSARYLGLLLDYQRALVQKNAALRAGTKTGGFDDLLVERGASIMVARHDYLQSLQPATARYYALISGSDQFAMGYVPSVDVTTFDAAEVAERFAGRLREVALREQESRAALVGPHRDEVSFTIRGLPARTHGSQGEWRTAAVALKLAVYELLRRHHGSPPILLLDEVFAELDNDRSRSLVAALADFDQLLMTTAGEPPQPLRAAGRCFEVISGRVTG